LAACGFGWRSDRLGDDEPDSDDGRSRKHPNRPCQSSLW